MKTKFKIALCIVFVFVFSLIPLTAFAYTDSASAQTLYNIAKNTGETIYPNYQIIYEDQDNFYLWSVGYYVTMESPNIRPYVTSNSYPTDIIIRGGQLTAPISTNLFTFPKSNIYDCSFSAFKTDYENGTSKPKINNVINILYSSKDILVNGSDTVFFWQMSSIPTSTSRVPLNTVLTSTLLSGILDELIAMLPVLFPVLITFIAIRKGIAFTLTILRSL